MKRFSSILQFALLATSSHAVFAASDLGPLPGVTMRVVNFSSDEPGKQQRAPGGGRILTPAVLYTPAAGDNAYAPAIVILDQGPGTHPMEPGQATRFAGERLAAMGYTVLSLYGGQERGYSLTPFSQTAWAIKGALDYLEIGGHDRFVLVGQGYGAIAVANYLATQPDTLLDAGGEKRVKAAVLLNPLTELREYPRADLKLHYDERVAQAEASMAAGRGGYPDLEPGHAAEGAYDPWLLAGPYIGPPISFLDYWGPQAARRNADVLGKLAVPTLIVAGGRDPETSVAKLRALKTGSSVDIEVLADADDHFDGVQPQVTQDIARWLGGRDIGVSPRVAIHVLDTTTEGGRALQGILYEPDATVDKRRPLLMLIDGRTADTLQGSSQWMGVRLASKGLAVFSPGLRVSGGAGFQSSGHDEAAQDIGHWVDRMTALGYTRIVLAGHSNGGIWLSNYLSRTQDKRVVGTIYFAPTRDSATFAKAVEGEHYASNVAEARAAVARGDGLRKVIGVMSAQTYLDNNGPDTRGYHTERVKEFDRPGLAIVGGKDALMSADFLAEFKRDYRGKLTIIRYPEGSHGLRESKPRLGDDVAAWIAATFP